MKLMNLFQSLRVIPEVAECPVRYNHKAKGAGDIYFHYVTGAMGVYLPDVSIFEFGLVVDIAHEAVISGIFEDYNVPYDDNTVACFVLLHEVGHYVDHRDRYKYNMNEAGVNRHEEMQALHFDNYVNRNPDMLRTMAYREIPSEKFADDWAIKHLKAYLAGEYGPPIEFEEVW